LASLQVVVPGLGAIPGGPSSICCTGFLLAVSFTIYQRCVLLFIVCCVGDRETLLRSISLASCILHCREVFSCTGALPYHSNEQQNDQQLKRSLSSNSCGQFWHFVWLCIEGGFQLLLQAIYSLFNKEQSFSEYFCYCIHGHFSLYLYGFCLNS